MKWCNLAQAYCASQDCVLQDCYAYNFLYNKGWDIPQEIKFNYECPDCHGRFNEPQTDLTSTNAKGNPRCPFCGRLMGGM